MIIHMIIYMMKYRDKSIADNQMNNLEHLALELKQKRDLKLLDSLSPNKVLKVQYAEYRFKREMILKIIKKTNQEAEKK